MGQDEKEEVALRVADILERLDDAVVVHTR